MTAEGRLGSSVSFSAGDQGKKAGGCDLRDLAGVNLLEIQENLGKSAGGGVVRKRVCSI